MRREIDDAFRVETDSLPEFELPLMIPIFAFVKPEPRLLFPDPHKELASSFFNMINYHPYWIHHYFDIYTRNRSQFLFGGGLHPLLMSESWFWFSK